MVLNAILGICVVVSLWNAAWIDATADRVYRDIPRFLFPQISRAIRHRIYFSLAVLVIIFYRLGMATRGS